MRTNLWLSSLLVVGAFVAGFVVRGNLLQDSSDSSQLKIDAYEESSNEPNVNELREADTSESPLLGRWFYTVCLSGNVPTEINFVQIADDGVYDELTLEPIPDKIPAGSEGDWLPVGMEIRSHTRGRIDLATGKELMDEQVPRSLAVSVDWTVEEGLLWRRTDTGNAGDGVSFTRELR